MTDAIKFPTGFNAYVCIGDSIECESGPFTIRATIEHDSDTGAPWSEHDGHGPVSEWTTRAKRPGELVLCTSRGRKRYYDFAEACRIARRDGWGWMPGKVVTVQNSGGLWHSWCDIGADYPIYNTGGHADINAATRAAYAAHRATMSAKQYAAEAAMRDFKALRAWCNDEWFWCGITVTTTVDGIELASESLWGIECNHPGSDNSYLTDCAMEMAESALSEARNRARTLATALNGVE